MITILTGPPGAGKGTQADMLVENGNFGKLSTGDALRSQIKAGSEIGKKAESYMANGKLVPDDVLLKVLTAELSKVKGRKILLDGYPRNMVQVETLEGLASEYPVTTVVDIQVPRDQLVERICGRRVCSGCGASYHMTFSPPAADETCVKCGYKVQQRPDDSEEKASVRLEVYESETRPILDYYEKRGICQHVDGRGDVKEVFGRISKSIS